MLLAKNATEFKHLPHGMTPIKAHFGHFGQILVKCSRFSSIIRITSLIPEVKRKKLPLGTLIENPEESHVIARVKDRKKTFL